MFGKKGRPDHQEAVPTDERSTLRYGCGIGADNPRMQAGPLQMDPNSDADNWQTDLTYTMGGPA